MKALVYTGTQELVYRDEVNPSEVSGESILKVHASGICGSDMHAYHGHDERRVPPLILGHEVSGQVQNGKFKGKDVVLNPLITCGKCEYCTSGREHLCPNRIILGMNRPIERQGVFAEFVSTPDQNIYEIPNGLDKNEAPVAEPTAVSLHAVLIGEQSLKKPLSECKTLIQGGGGYWFDWACQPFFTLLLTFIFAPFFAQVATEYYASGGLSEQSADARAQTLWSTGITIAGLIIAFSAPVLGAIADSSGRRMPWISFFTAAAIFGAAATWFMDPAGSNLVTMLVAFVICYIGAELAFIFASAQLPDLGDDDSVGGISGSGLAFGYVGGVLSLVIILLLFVGQENGKTIFLNLDPLFFFYEVHGLFYLTCFVSFGYS